MKLLAWTLNRGENDLEDFYSIHNDMTEAREYLDQQFKEDGEIMHMWAISDILDASEPHWVGDEDADG